MLNLLRSNQNERNFQRHKLALAFLIGLLASVVTVDVQHKQNNKSKAERGVLTTERFSERVPSGSDHPFDDPMEKSLAVDNNAAREPASIPVWEDGHSLESLKFLSEQEVWDGKAQLLPNPMFVEELTTQRMKALRGAGWLAIDLGRGEVLPVELFKSSSSKYTSRAVVEAKVVEKSLDGRSHVLNTVNTGIPVIRGIDGIAAGKYEVPETPSCLVRYGNVRKEEHCLVVGPQTSSSVYQLRFRFDPPDSSFSKETPSSDRPASDTLSSDAFLDVDEFEFTTVYVQSQPGKWLEIGTFNESFQPIGDPNHDGYPDFYLESLTETSSNGRHDLLISSVQGEGVVYMTYSAGFIGR
jgi:hypothetical protein